MTDKTEKMIADLETQKAQKYVEYKNAKLKADELSQAAKEIEDFLHQEEKRDQQKKKNKGWLE